MIPGLLTAAGSAGLVVLIDGETEVDIASRVGSPNDAISLTVIVPSGSTIGSADIANAALDMSGLASGSRVHLINLGRIQGKGGDGGDGSDGNFAGGSGPGRGGGGGGGAGTNVGTGGTATSPATAGSDGTDDTGGAAGATASSTTTAFVFGTAGEDGGDAINAGSVTLSITNADGEIWGGGGGGGGGARRNSDILEPGAGGDPGEAGANGATLGGAGGYAVRGSSVTFISGGSDPNVKGTVG